MTEMVLVVDTDPAGLTRSMPWSLQLRLRPCSLQMTPLVVTFVSYTFFALEALSDEIENPFGLDANDLALDAMVSSIDASLREMLGEVPPPVPRPDANFVLT